MTPSDTRRLHFREMTDDDLDDMAAMLGDPEVMTFYVSPKSRSETQGWIDWNKKNYAEFGFGLWIVETLDGKFVGDCGLTWQQVDGVRMLEVGYHIRRDLQGYGYATEAASACREYAAQLGQLRLVAIIHPENVPSQRVAEKIGLSLQSSSIDSRGQVRSVFGAPL
ncbi:MAG TPA: GNAT family N-acetyltransferase [Galbitalea sp.]|nr:GNAT family N-acetyltransferase [Galbitalea sp.]